MGALRRRLALLVWWLAVAAALLLAIGALLSNVFEDPDTVVVRQILDAAAVVAGPFDDLFHFYREGTAITAPPHDVPREDLVNWGIAAVLYLAAGRLLDALIRPRDGRPAGAVPTPRPGPDEPGGAAAGSEASQRSQ